MTVENTISGVTSDVARGLIMQGSAATQVMWKRIQTVRCRENVPHHRYLCEARVGGKDKIIIDLGAGPHNP